MKYKAFISYSHSLACKRPSIHRLKRHSTAKACGMVKAYGTSGRTFGSTSGSALNNDASIAALLLILGPSMGRPANLLQFGSPKNGIKLSHPINLSELFPDELPTNIELAL